MVRAGKALTRVDRENKRIKVQEKGTHIMLLNEYIMKENLDALRFLRAEARGRDHNVRRRN